MTVKSFGRTYRHTKRNIANNVVSTKSSPYRNFDYLPYVTPPRDPGFTLTAVGSTVSTLHLRNPYFYC